VHGQGRCRHAVALAAVTGFALVAVVGLGPAAAADASGPSVRPAVVGLVPGLPAGAATAARSPEPALPVPGGWPFPDAFSRTSGTGRLIRGALEWSDWVYDDYGASSPEGAPLNTITYNGALSPAQGDYVYPSGGADNDGADIFRAAVGLTRKDTIWRVDWNTLADPSVPIAEWTFDTDHNAHTGTSVWPADANVSSPGIDKALVVSATGAELIDATGKTIATFRPTVDQASRSFLVTIPRSVLPVRGTWRIRLAAGLANKAGTQFAVPTLSGGIPASSRAPRVYNITFRTAAQEPPIFTDGQTDAQVARLRSELQGSPILGAYGADGVTSLVTGNFWGEDDQADTLASGNVSKFSELVKWKQLATKKTTAAPLVKGYSDRWYVTDVSLGQGVDDSNNANPAYLGRVQPYAVYVPTSYTGRTPLPLTWILHSLDVNYNQYGALDPRQIQEECQARDSICVSPEGFGPAGDWAGEAEHDFWQVWRQVALGYRLDAERTVISGYSMGGLGSFTIGETYPEDFSEAMPLDGVLDDSCIGTDRAANARWEPYVISNAVADELSVYPAAAAEAAEFAGAGDRYTLFSTTMPEHNATAASDGFSTQIAALHGTPSATTDPGTISYTWCSNVVDPTLGLGPTSVYWLSRPTQRSTSSTSQITADDGAIATPPETEQTATSVANPSDAPPMLVLTGSWRPGVTPAPAQTLSLDLTNVGSLTVDTQAAKLPKGAATVTTDGATGLSLTNLAAGTVVTAAGKTVVSDSNGTATVDLPDGTTAVSW
jgi:hypothetical protein